MPREVWIAGGGITVSDGDRTMRARPRATSLMFGRPRPAHMVGEGAVERERALLEIVVVVRRQLGDVARTVLRIEIVHHQGRAAEDAAEAARRRRHVEAVGADAKAADRLGPGLERRHVRMRLGIGPRRSRTWPRGPPTASRTCGPAGRLRQRDTAVAGRHDHQRIAVDLQRSRHWRIHRSRCVAIRQQQHIFVRLIVPLQHCRPVPASLWPTMKFWPRVSQVLGAAADVPAAPSRRNSHNLRRREGTPALAGCRRRGGHARARIAWSHTSFFSPIIERSELHERDTK